MAATSGWEPSGSAGTVGNDQKSNNRSGFTALPGGYKAWPSYRALGTNATFWMAYEINVWSPWIRELSAGGDNLDTLGRFPITLYKEQWLKLLDMSDGIRAFIAANDAQLKTKG